MAVPRRPAERRRAPGLLRPGVVISAFLHLGLAALAVLASLRREKPPEPASPPAYTVQFEGGPPEQAAEAEANPPPSEIEAPDPEPAVETTPDPSPPPPDLASARTEEPAPPPLPDEPRTAEAELPPPLPLEEAPAAEAEPPRPEDPVPAPPPSPPRAQREALLAPPPRPPRPQSPSGPLPGLFMPEARRLQPMPQPSFGPRPRLDLAPAPPSRPGRDAADLQYSLKGANVGPDWHSALRRWWIENRRYPMNAAVVGDQGAATVEMVLAPDGQVRSVRLVRPSGSVWLDAGAVSQFRGATLPALPPGTDPSGALLVFTINYILIR